jgi:hypothetical protein
MQQHWHRCEQEEGNIHVAHLYNIATRQTTSMLFHLHIREALSKVSIRMQKVNKTTYIPVEQLDK